MKTKRKTNGSDASGNRRWASSTLALLIVISLGVGSGLAHGLLDGRWATQPDLQAIGSRLDRLPAQVGDWVLLEDSELPESALEMLRCYGHTYRTYQNSKSGARVSMAILFGPRGPIAVHTPEICYSSHGITQHHDRQQVTIAANGRSHTLWKVDFQSKASGQPELQVYYAWSDGGAWQASEHPRFWLTDRLYKIQLSGPPAQPGVPSECNAFLEQFLPAIDSLIVPKSKTT